MLEEVGCGVDVGCSDAGPDEGFAALVCEDCGTLDCDAFGEDHGIAGLCARCRDGAAGWCFTEHETADHGLGDGGSDLGVAARELDSEFVCRLPKLRKDVADFSFG